MGLDQYLNAHNYYSPMSWRGEDVNNTYNEIIKALEADTFVETEFPSVEVSIKVGYWRKSNQIHDWFVNNVQSGEDDCREYQVEREQLVELKELCEQVIADHSLAESLLPTSDGFFFGSTDYDEYYFGDLIATVQMIENIVNNVPDGWSFTYQSSW